MIPARALLLLLALLPLSALAQQRTTAAPVATAAAIPEGLRGPWFSGGACDAPGAMIFVTARGALLVPAGGAPVLHRFGTIAVVPGGWTLGTAGGPQAPRLALRSPGPDRLDVLEPAAKTRDDRLPGEGATLSQWRRCAALPAGLVARHAEAIDTLLVLEQVEIACGPGALVAECLASLVARLDVTGDGVLSVAELARFGRGAARLAALHGGAPVAPGAPDAALAAARRLVDALDYDGDGKLSAAELLQDRTSLGAMPAGAGPLSALPAVPGLDALQPMLPAR